MKKIGPVFSKRNISSGTLYRKRAEFFSLFGHFEFVIIYLPISSPLKNVNKQTSSF